MTNTALQDAVDEYTALRNEALKSVAAAHGVEASKLYDAARIQDINRRVEKLREETADA